MNYLTDQAGRKYQLKGGKHTCPHCQNHSLQLYVNLKTGDSINDMVGKCDHHYSCGYNLTPRDYFQDHPEELPTKARDKVKKPKTLVTIHPDYVRKSLVAAEPGKCSFIDILLRMFRKEDVERVCELYQLGATKHKAVIFWQISEQYLIHEGKAMAYGASDEKRKKAIPFDESMGKRDKASWATGESKWIFSTLQGRGLLPNDAESEKICFGQHLLRNANKNINVCVTESEKNAVFGSIAFPDYTWLAVGSSQELGKLWKIRDTLAKCRSVILVPDSDSIQEDANPNWNKKAEELKLPNLKIWKICQGHASGWDLADYIQDKWMQKAMSNTGSSRATITAYHRQCEKKQTSSPDPPTPTPTPPRKTRRQLTDDDYFMIATDGMWHFTTAELQAVWT